LKLDKARFRLHTDSTMTVSAAQQFRTSLAMSPARAAFLLLTVILILPL
jgi:hypothetical protein